MYKKIVPFLLGFNFLLQSSVVNATELAEINNSGRIKINFIQEENIEVDAIVYLYDKTDDLNVYSYKISAFDDFEKSYNVPFGEYYVAALPKGSCGGGSIYAFANEFEIEINQENSEVINVILGSKEFVEDNKVLLYEVDEEGNCQTGVISYEEANKDTKNISNEASQKENEIEEQIKNNMPQMEVVYEQPEEYENITENTTEKENKFMSLVTIISNIIAVILLFICVIIVKQRGVNIRKNSSEYDEETLKRAKEYADANGSSENKEYSLEENVDED